MQATKRAHESSVIGLLLDAPQRFRFAQLLNLLLRELRLQGVSYERAFREVISFRNSLSLSFPASEVQALDVEPQAQDTLGAMRRGEVARIRITPAFIGLLGAGGTLPLHDTERIASRQAQDRDASQRELLDVLSNRLVWLFYEAWAKYRVEHDLDVRGHDRLLPMLSAIAGAPTGRPSPSPFANQASLVKRETIAYYSGLLRTRPVSASTVERVLAAHFGVPVQLEQFVGCWDSIAENRRSKLGTTVPVLGFGATLGVRIWRHDLRARLHIGPLDEVQARGFLPGGKALAALEEIACLFALPGLRYEVRLLLAPSAVKPLTLRTRTTPHRLGWTTFLTGTPGVALHPEIRRVLRRPAGAMPIAVQASA